MESPLARASLRRKNMEVLGDVLRELAPLKAAFPCLIKLVQIALTLVVSSATCQHSFSALERIRPTLLNYDRRLNDLATFINQKGSFRNT